MCASLAQAKKKYLDAIPKEDKATVETAMLQQLSVAKRASYLLTLPEAERQIALLSVMSEDEAVAFMSGRMKILGLDGTTTTRFELEHQTGLEPDRVAKLTTGLPRMEAPDPNSDPAPEPSPNLDPHLHSNLPTRTYPASRT